LSKRKLKEKGVDKTFLRFYNRQQDKTFDEE